MEVDSIADGCADSSSHYLNYKALKKQINSARKPSQANHDHSPDLTGCPFCDLLILAFFYELDRNVESVEDFFTKKSSDMQRRLKLLIDKYGDSKSDQLDLHELEDLVLLHWFELMIGRRIDGLALANAEIIGFSRSNFLTLVVCRCE